MKTITITDPMQVKPGDKAYFKDCDLGFTVLKVDELDTDLPFTVMTPLGDGGYWVQSSHFDHAERTIDESEWPDPNDLRLHVYLGADDMKYIYNPCIVPDPAPWIAEGSFASRDRQQMTSMFPEALPLTELELITKDVKE